MNRRIPLSYRFTRSFDNVVFSTLGVVVFYQIINLLRPNHGDLRPLFEGRFKDWAFDFLSYYLVFETISVFLLFQLLHLYVFVFKLDSIKFEWSDIFVLFAKFLPFVFLSIFIFAPVTNTIRYLGLHFPHVSWAEYYPEYVFTWSMYLKYLVPVFFFIYASLGYNFFRDYDDWQRDRYKALKDQQTRAEDGFVKILETLEADGKGKVAIKDVLFFEVRNKKYWAVEAFHKREVSQNLTELEELLDSEEFFRVNRSQIINLQYFKNYAFWEYDKYIVRLHHTTEEFVCQRVKLKILKQKLKLA